MSRDPSCPAGISTAGRLLWKRIVGDVSAELELDRRDLQILGRACKQADRIAELDSAIARDGMTLQTESGPRLHPAAAELRLLEAGQSRLLAAIDLDVAAAGGQSAISRRARKAAQKRWAQAGPSRRPAA